MSSANQDKPFSWNLPELSIRGAGQEDRSSGYENGSLLEYACPVFHRTLPGYLSDDLERLQRRALRIIFPSLSYSGAIVESGLTTLYQRREEISQRTFNELANDNEHKLYHLLPIRSNSNYATRHQRKFNLPRVKTERCKNSFIISHIYK